MRPVQLKHPPTADQGTGTDWMVMASALIAPHPASL